MYSSSPFPRLVIRRSAREPPRVRRSFASARFRKRPVASSAILFQCSALLFQCAPQPPSPPNQQKGSQGKYTDIDAYIHTYIRTNIHTCMHAYRCIQIHIDTCRNVYIYIYMYMYIHIYINLYIYI